MNSIRRVKMTSVLVALIASLAVAATSVAAESAKVVAIDPARPDTWAAAVAALVRQEYALTDGLITVAKDEKRTPEDRRKAVFTLSALRNRHSLEFLIENVSLKLPMPNNGGQEDPLKEAPCAYVLAEGADWGTAQAIILCDDDRTRTPRDLMLLAHALELILGKDLAIAAVSDTLQHRVPPIGSWRKNLTGIKTYLQQ